MVKGSLKNLIEINLPTNEPSLSPTTHPEGLKN